MMDLSPSALFDVFSKYKTNWKRISIGILLLLFLSVLRIHYSHKSNPNPPISLLATYKKFLQIHTSEIVNLVQNSSNVSFEKSNEYFMYSAYLDNYGNRSIIRIVGIEMTKLPKDYSIRVYCHFYDDTMNPNLEDGTLGRVKQTNNLYVTRHFYYRAGFILCDVDDFLQKYGKPPTHVFISFRSDIGTQTKVKNYPSDYPPILPVSIANEGPEPHEFGLCVQPTFSYNQVFNFIQWAEFYKMMGITHFTFYNISIGPDVSCIMEKVYGDEIMKILPWRRLEMRVNSQMMQINDCAFRYRGLAKYLVMVDFDEFIIPDPKYAQNYSSMLSGLNLKIKNPDKVAQYLFKNAFFFVTPSRPNFQRLTKEDLILFRNTVRVNRSHPHRTRSKFITVPKRIIEPGVHQSFEKVDGCIEFDVQEDFAYVHHYRSFRNGDCSVHCNINETSIDIIGQFYADMLLKNVKTMLSLARSKCNITILR